MAITGMGCGGGDTPPVSERETDDRALSPAQYTLMNLAGTDALGRKIEPMDGEKEGTRYSGIFYSLWLGQHQYMQTAIYDINELLSTEEGAAALKSTEANNPLSPVGEFHFCGEPLFGYYNMRDPWVIMRHMEMLTMAGIDYLAVDATNASFYPEVCYTLFETITALQRQGFTPPKVMFYTNSNSGTTVKKIYNEFYQTEKYDHIWFSPNGKPMIVGITENNNNASDQTKYPGTYGESSKDFIPQEIRYRFDIVESQWPNGDLNNDSIPWMSWSYPQPVHENSKAISVSVAQHSPSRIHYSYMDPQSSRGYDYKTGRIEADWQRGKNFENQWQTVFDNEGLVENVLVTGWNEWMAVKQPDGNFCDDYTSEYSRDIEPDNGPYGDNFYLQLIRNLRSYKYTQAKHYKYQKMTIDLSSESSLTQWDHVKAHYLDISGDAMARDYENAVGTAHSYTDSSNRNDIAEVKVVHDSKNLYFYVKTKEDVTAHQSGDTGWMNILISAGSDFSGKSDFCGYNYLINRTPGADGATSVERSKGGYAWETAGSAQYRVYGNVMLCAVPLSALGLTSDSCYIQFKVTDNVQNPGDIMDYYVSGDNAPIGRLSYAYGY